MASSSSPLDHPQIILFQYSISPWSRKVRMYLALRHIPYTECEAPMTLPRPIFEKLRLAYRRIPVLAIGKDIYCDTLLILPVLEDLYPPSQEHPPLSASQKAKYSGSADANGGTKGANGGPVAKSSEHELFALEHLLEKWTDMCVFQRAAETIPYAVYEKIPGFMKDREALWGRSWSAEEQGKRRPEALAVLRGNFEFLERMLGDERRWISGEEGPLLADIHAAWVFAWLLELPNALPDDIFNKHIYPHTLEYLQRYQKVFEHATGSAKITKIDDAAVIKAIESSKYHSQPSDTSVDEQDPHHFALGDEVIMYPLDTGNKHREQGKLLALNTREVALSKTTQNGVEIRVHYPRWQVRIERVEMQHGDLAVHGGDEGLGAEFYEDRH